MTNLVRLARPLQLVGILEEVVFPANYILAAPSPMRGCLYLFPSSEEHETDKEPDVGAFEDFESFHGRVGSMVSEVDVPDHWRPHDYVHEIVYLSRKKNGGGDGRPNRFRHRFSHGTHIEIGPRGWIRIRGNGLYVSDRGIVN